MPSKGSGPSNDAWRTIQGYEVMQMIRKGQVQWLAKGAVAGQVLFIHQILALKAA
jgi:hypothetical protein